MTRKGRPGMARVARGAFGTSGRAPLSSGPNPNITGNRSYTRAHFLCHAQVVTPGTYR